MDFVIADFEWNGAYSKKAHGYFNEIIEIGAVKMNESLEIVDRFQAMIKPTVTKKLSKVVTELTHISAEALEDDGVTFAQAFSRLRRWIGGPAVFMTWSTTDLLVLLEDFRYYYRMEKLPFLTHYADLQAYFQKRMQVASGQQVGLSRAAEMLEIPAEDIDNHRALDDSELSARILQRVYDAASFESEVSPCDDTFYRRITFKNTFISDPHDERIDLSQFTFTCEECGKPLHRTNSWRFHNRCFNADMICRRCKRKYTGRIQCKLRFEGIEYKAQLVPKVEKTETVAPETVTEQS